MAACAGRVEKWNQNKTGYFGHAKLDVTRGESIRFLTVSFTFF